MADILKMEEVEIPKYSVLVRPGYRQHASAGWKGDLALQYNTYIIQEGASLKDDDPFACGTSLCREAGFPRNYRSNNVEDEGSKVRFGTGSRQSRGEEHENESEKSKEEAENGTGESDTIPAKPGSD